MRYLSITAMDDAIKVTTPNTEGLGTPGAIESNAGDDYHVLWACRQALRLLEFDNDLSMVRVEGVSHADEISVVDPDSFLGVDLTEYYGGESFTTASQVVVSQLKYSQRHPDRPWTAARLCERVQGKKERSVIARLAQAFSGFCEGTEAHLVAERVVVKLVSNRPADTILMEATKSAQAWLEGKTTPQASKLINALPPSNRDPIQRLRNSCDLSSAAFCNFLKCLDFSDCNSDGRLWQRLRLIQEIGAIAPASPLEHVRDLYERVASEALPKVGTLGLRRADILAALGCHSEESIFPAPSRFEKTSHLIPTSDAGEIVQKLRAAPLRNLLAHGAGGVGKTTTVLSLPQHWGNARWVFYDCFGGGTYKDSPGDERHSPRRALLQLSNQLAVVCGSPFMIRPPTEMHDLWREFRSRLNGAASILQNLGESLILVIDAADNATLAADTPGDSFVVDLWKISKPENVYLLMTARSGGRAQSLGAPEGTALYEMTGFNEQGSSQYLRLSCPNASDSETKAFHVNSHGNPRVQTYALGDAHSNIPAILEQARRGLDDIFRDYVTAALTLKFSSGNADDHLDDLSCFPRPLLQDHLIEVLGLPSAEINNLCNALSPGLSKDMDGWTFRDEDFDTFLHSRINDLSRQRSAHLRLADRMASLPESGFAARHYAEHLFCAEDDQAVIKLALKGNTAISRQMDEVAQTQLLRRRLALGVKSAARSKQPEALVRLTVQAADAARSDHAILKLIEDHAELAALYADPRTISNHYLNAQGQRWFGGAQLRCSALFSRYPNYHARARDHWEMAQAWLRRWIAKSPKDRNTWSIADNEIAAGAEALFRLSGPVAAFDWLKRWRPFDNVLKACQILAQAIAGEVPAVRQTELYNSLSLHPLVSLIFLIAFHKAGERPEKIMVEAVLSSVEAFCRLKRKLSTKARNPKPESTLHIEAELGIDFAELLPSYGIEFKRIVWILKILCPVRSNFPPRDAYHASHFIPQLRVVALFAELEGIEVDTNRMQMQLLKFHEKSSEHEVKEERRRFDVMIQPRYNIYRLRAEALVRAPNFSSLLPKLKNALEGGTEERWRYGRNFDFYFRDALLPLANTALACPGDIDTFLELLITTTAERLGEGAPDKWIDLAELLFQRGKHIRLANDLIDRVVKYLSEHPTNGKEHCEALLRSAAIVEPHDSIFGADLFHQAVTVARELNDDLCERLKYLASSSKEVGHDINESDARDLSARLVRLAEETRVYIANEEEYPWDNVLNAVITLHTPSAYALYTRWADLDYTSLRSEIVNLSSSSLDEERIDSRSALSLLRLAWDRSRLVDSFTDILQKELAKSGLNSNNFRSLLTDISEWILRDIERNDRHEYARTIVHWLNQNKIFQIKEAQPLYDYLEFFANHLKQKLASSDQPEAGEHGGNDNEVIDWNTYIGQNPVPARLHELLVGIRKLPGYQSRSTFFEHVRKLISTSERLAYLQALLDLPSDLTTSDDFLDEWEVCLTSWEHSFQVQKWAEIGVVQLVCRHLPSILGYQYHAGDRLARLLRLPFIKQKRGHELLGPALADWVERLDAWQLYPIASVLAKGLSTEQRKDLLVNAIIHGEEAIESRVRKALRPLPLWDLYGSDQNTPFATMLFTLLGDPDTRIRWSCLHSLSLLDLQDRPQLLSKLMDMLNVTSVGGFLPPDSTFLWMSARAYLMIFFSRFGSIHPNALLPHVETLVKHALCSNFPHAQIRELAKRAVISVDDAIPGVVSKGTREQLELVNQPKIRIREEGQRRTYSDDRNHKGRFDFNSLDTLPYWYSPLGRRFDLSADHIATMAERWICDQWGIFDRDACIPRKKRRDRDWSLATNDHGSLPVIEEGQTYFEYHAMLLVAGELADSVEVITDSSDSSYDSWDRWLAEHLPTHGNTWLSTLRSAVPLESLLNGFKQPQHYYQDQPLPSAFDTCLGLSQGKFDFFVAAASVEIKRSEGDERWQVESALVTPDSAHALMRALQSADDPHSYRLPPAGGGLEIEFDDFSLQGWINDASAETALDGRDTLLYHMNTGIGTFPHHVCESLGVMAEVGSMRYVDMASNQLIAEARAWSEPHEDREGAEYSTGWQLRIIPTRLLQFLKNQNRCLILEVKIVRKEKRHDQEEKYGYTPPRVLIYLLHSNGRLETLEHYHCIGTDDTC